MPKGGGQYKFSVLGNARVLWTKLISFSDDQRVNGDKEMAFKLLREARLLIEGLDKNREKKGKGTVPESLLTDAVRARLAKSIEQRRALLIGGQNGDIEAVGDAAGAPRRHHRPLSVHQVRDEGRDGVEGRALGAAEQQDVVVSMPEMPEPELQVRGGSVRGALGSGVPAAEGGRSEQLRSERRTHLETVLQRARQLSGTDG